MDCREFKERHLAFLDDTMSELEVVAMYRHIAECDECARRDTAIRRGLLVLRNLPQVEPSPDFASRLAGRIRQMQRADARATLYRGPGIATFLAMAASVVTIGFVTATAFDWTEMRRDLALPPVVVATTEAPPSPIADYTFAAASATGMPIWPAAVLAEQAPVHFANWSR